MANQFTLSLILGALAAVNVASATFGVGGYGMGYEGKWCTRGWRKSKIILTVDIEDLLDKTRPTNRAPMSVKLQISLLKVVSVDPVMPELVVTLEPLLQLLELM